MLKQKASQLLLHLISNSCKIARFGTRATEEPPYLELQRDFLDPAEFYSFLKKSGVDFYTGVPDSLLKDFCAYVSDNTSANNHVIAANEGLALSLAVGYHLATRKIPLVYMQNSGLGNIVNPLLSLAHPKVYGIPMLLMIGWRGEPGKKDEPQHLVQGKRMIGMLTEMGLQHEVLPDYMEGAKEVIESAMFNMKKRSSPYALLVRRQCFSNYKLKAQIINEFEMNREQALDVIIPVLGDHDVVVATTGFLSRELFELRKNRKQTGDQDFYTVGSMGHASSIALGIAMMKKSRNVYCFDGDGAALMHLGSFATIGQIKPQNLKHIVFNNGSHDSVGGQLSAGFDVDFTKIAIGAGYQEAFSVSTKKELNEAITKIKTLQGPVMLEVKIKNGARKNLGRPDTSTLDNKANFMQFLEQ